MAIEPCSTVPRSWYVSVATFLVSRVFAYRLRLCLSRSARPAPDRFTPKLYMTSTWVKQLHRPTSSATATLHAATFSDFRVQLGWKMKTLRLRRPK